MLFLTAVKTSPKSRKCKRLEVLQNHQNFVPEYFDLVPMHRIGTRSNHRRRFLLNRDASLREFDRVNSNFLTNKDSQRINV